jgi:hypothetical protein
VTSSKKALGEDFREAAGATGGAGSSEGGNETIRLRMINKVYELRREGLFENGEYCRDPWTKIIIYDYVRRKGSRPLTGEWITLGHFSHTASHVRPSSPTQRRRSRNASGMTWRD